LIFLIIGSNSALLKKISFSFSFQGIRAFFHSENFSFDVVSDVACFLQLGSRRGRFV
jgi:hypothetical protein